MPYRLTEEDMGLVFVFDGHLTFEELFQALKASWEHPNQYSRKYTICDMRAVKSFAVETIETVLLGKMSQAAHRTGHPRRAVAVTSDPAIIEHIETFIRGQDTGTVKWNICATEEAAREWAMDESMPSIALGNTPFATRTFC